MRITGRLPAVIIEYDSRNSRVQRTFEDPYAARRFYVAKTKLGKHPTIVKERINENDNEHYPEEESCPEEEGSSNQEGSH